MPLFTFTTPDAPLPASSGDGLNGLIWTGVNVDNLADACTFIGANSPDASFIASTVDYPNGLAGSTSADTLFKDALGGTDAATLSNPAVGTTAVLNSIIQFTGFLRIDNPGSLILGIGSDDGTELLIQGTQVQNNDLIHAFPGPAAPVEVGLDAAGLYELEILFFESQVF